MVEREQVRAAIEALRNTGQLVSVRTVHQRLMAQGQRPGYYADFARLVAEVKQELGLVPEEVDESAEASTPSANGIEPDEEPEDDEPLREAAAAVDAARAVLTPLEDALSTLTEARTEALQALHATMLPVLAWERLGRLVPDEEPAKVADHQAHLEAERRFVEADRALTRAQGDLVVPRKCLQDAEQQLARVLLAQWLAQQAPALWDDWQQALADYAIDLLCHEHLWRRQEHARQMADVDGYRPQPVDLAQQDRALARHRERLTAIHRQLSQALVDAGQGANLIPCPPILLHSEVIDDRGQVQRLALARTMI